jgi:hypothetical protein
MAAGPHEDGEVLLRVIEAAWSKTQQHWCDEIASHFAGSYWEPLADGSHAYLRALGECMELMAAAERETSY